MLFSEYTTKTPEEALNKLGSSMGGLSKKEVLLRQAKYGANEVKEKSRSAWDVFLRQLKSPFTYLLMGAAAISFFLGNKIDFSVIAIVVLANILIGFLQEYRAERAVFLLRKYISPNVKVLRQSKEQMVSKKDLVMGDIVLLEPGDRVPADLRILKTENFLADESVLTGESLPVAKSVLALPQEAKEIFAAKNILFEGTSVISGKAEGVVAGIGKDTAFGGIAEIASAGPRKESAYEKSIVYFCKLVLRIVLVTIAILFLSNFLLKGISNFFEFLLFCVALVVSILPEALPAVVTFSLSRGSLQMAKKHVVVRRLSAIEDLGNIEVLCTDKTGTLTENKLTLEKIVSSDKRKCLLYGLLSSGINDRKQSILNPFDMALFDKSPDGFWKEYKKYSIISELPFDSERMRSSFLVKKNINGENILIVKGAPEIVLDLCGKTGGISRKEIKEDSGQQGRAGKRVLALAYKKITKDNITEKDEHGLIFLGYFVFEDPLKPTAVEALKLAKKLGVKIKVITGDSKEVAGYVAQKLKLVTNASEVLALSELEQMMPDEFDQACIETDVFARISPEMKYKIVKSLQKRHDVGFLGEGINDVPALKIANAAIVVQSASDVSREVSDIVLLRKDLRVIVEGIEAGRNVYSNINKYIKCTLASNFGNFYSVAAVSLFVNYLPMLPAQILLANLLTDLPLVAVASDSVDTEELKKPKAYQLSSVLPLVLALAMVSTIFDLIFFAIFRFYPPAIVQTLWFIESTLSELVLIFLIRTRYLAWKAKMPAMSLVVLALASGFVAIFLPFFSFGRESFRFAAPPILPLMAILALAGAYAVSSEIAKLAYFKFFKRI